MEGFWDETNASCMLPRPSFVYPYIEDSSGLDLFVTFYMVYKFNNAERSKHMQFVVVGQISDSDQQNMSSDTILGQCGIKFHAS